MSSTSEISESHFAAEFEITSDPGMYSSRGCVVIGTSEAGVEIVIPDRFGYTTGYDFSPEAWDQIVDAVKQVEDFRKSVCQTAG